MKMALQPLLQLPLKSSLAPMSSSTSASHCSIAILALLRPDMLTPPRLPSWSACADFIALIVGWPLNSLLVKHGVHIQKAVLASRAGPVINELAAVVRFIKFFAREEHWINRALDAHEV